MTRKHCALLALLALCAVLLSGCAGPLAQRAASDVRQILWAAIDDASMPAEAKPALPVQTDAPAVQPTFVQEDDLFLYLADNTFTAGQLDTMEFVLRFGKEAVGPITIENESGETLLVAENDGSGLLRLTKLIYEEEAASGLLTARCGDMISNSVRYHVVPAITESMFASLEQTAQDLCAFLDASAFEDPYSEDALAQVEAHLLQDARVHSVSRHGDVLLYSTVDGLTGSYGLGRETEGYAGFAPPGETFEAWHAGQDVSQAVLKSHAPMTNTKCLILTPEGNDKTMGDQHDFAQSFMENSPMNVDHRLDEYAMQTLRDGDFVDCGLWVLNAHGSYIDRSDGTSLLFFCLGQLEDATMRALIDAENDNGYGIFWTKFDDRTETCRATLDVSIINGHALSTVRLSSLYLESAIGERTFDNTVILFCVCYGFCDVHLQNLFLSHGAAMFIGSPVSFLAAYTDLILFEIANAFFVTDEYDQPISVLDAAQNVSMITVDQFVQLLDDPSQPNFDLDSYSTYLDKYTDSYHDVADRACMHVIARGSTDIIPVASTANGKNIPDVLKGSVYGVVQTVVGVPIAGAEVTMYRWLDHQFTPFDPAASDTVSTPVTNNHGEYVFNNAPFGLYIIEAVKGESRAYILLEHTEAESTAEPILLSAPLILTGTPHVNRPLAYRYVGIAVEPKLLCGGANESALLAANSALDQLFDDVGQAFAAHADLADSETDASITYYNEFILEDVFATDGLLSLKGYYRELTNAAASGVGYPLNTVLDLLTGKPLSLRGMLDPDVPNAARAMASQIESALSAYENLDYPAAALAQTVLAGSHGTLSVSREGLVISFAPYEIASRSNGTMQIILLYDSLRGVVRDVYLPAASDLDGTCFLTMPGDARLENSAYRLLGEAATEGDLVLVADGAVSDVVVRQKHGDMDYGVVFYASELGNQAVALNGDSDYVVTYVSDGVSYTLRTH